MFIILIGLIVVGVSDLVFPVNLILVVYNYFTIYTIILYINYIYNTFFIIT